MTNPIAILHKRLPTLKQQLALLYALAWAEREARLMEAEHEQNRNTSD